MLVGFQGSGMNTSERNEITSETEKQNKTQIGGKNTCEET
jgi:hypothetical protein